MENNSTKNGYLCMYKGKKYEIYADTTLEAQTLLAKQLRVKKEYEISVYLCEKAGQQVITTIC